MLETVCIDANTFRTARRPQCQCILQILFRNSQYFITVETNEIIRIIRASNITIGKCNIRENITIADIISLRDSARSNNNYDIQKRFLLKHSTTDGSNIQSFPSPPL